MSKIGLAVITYNRPSYFLECIKSLAHYDYGGADELVVIDDGSDEKYRSYYEKIFDVVRTTKILKTTVLVNERNSGVAITKNRALQHLMMSGCNHLFIMEDDILMKDRKVCSEYIKYAKKNKLGHTNFGLHGNMNIGHKKEFKWHNKLITVYPNVIGAFSYYTREVIEKVGYMDENFHNAWEHVEHTKRIIDAGYHPPFWFFADHPDSDKLLKEITGSINNSSIRPRDDWQSSIDNGSMYWLKKYGSGLPDFPREFYGSS